MLDNLIFSLNIVVPLFAVILFGAFLRYKGYVDGAFIDIGNKIVFRFILPANVFMSIYHVNIVDIFDPFFIGFVVLFTVGSFFAVWLFALFFIKEKPIVSAFTQGAFRSNFAIIGLPLLVSILGPERAAVGAIALAFVVPVYNIFSTVVLTVHSPHIRALNAKILFLAIIKNPIIIAVALGMAVSVSGLHMPVAGERSVGFIAALTTPFALICLGGNISFRGFDAKFKYAAVATAVKLVVMPIVCTALAYALGFRGDELTVLMVMAGVPSAVAGYAMALQLGGDGYTSATIIVLTTLLSAFSLTVFIYVFRTLGIIVDIA